MLIFQDLEYIFIVDFNKSTFKLTFNIHSFRITIQGEKMNIQLKQLDITLNQYYNPDYNNIYQFRLSLKNRIDNRINQIINLLKLLNDNLSDIEFINIFNNVYDIRFQNKGVLNLNIVSDYNLTMIINYASDIKFDNVLYSIDEIIDLFKNNNIALLGINYVEFDSEYMKKYYDISNVNRINEEELSKVYNYILENTRVYNNNFIKDIREKLKREKILKDLNNLINFTSDEFNYIDKKCSHQKLTCNNKYGRIPV